MRLLFTQSDVHRWAWDRVLSCLLPVDAVRLVVAVLETRGTAFAGLVRWLLDGDAPFALLRTVDCVDEAARAGCWRATAWLLYRLQPPPVGVAHADPSTTACGPQGPLELAREAQQHAVHQFPVSVIKAAAARGDFLAVRWLFRATDVRVCSCKHKVPHFSLEDKVIRAAANARQLDLVDSLLAYSENIEILVPYDSKLQLMVWSRRISAYPGATFHCWATAKYGFRCRYVVGLSKIAPWTSLADPFAADGDLEMLEDLESLFTKIKPEERLFTPNAMVFAAKGGHLQVVQWLYERLPQDLGERVLEVAAENGHVEILKWALEQGTGGIVADEFDGCSNSAARGGQLNVLRWLQSEHLLVCDDDSEHRFPSVTAIRAGHLPTVRFLVEECLMSIASCDENSLGQCPDLATAAYALDMRPRRNLDHEHILRIAAASSTLEVVQYFVLTKGFVFDGLISSVIYRPEVGVSISKFLYEHAKEQAQKQGTTLESVLDIQGFTILSCISEGFFDAAKWLAESVPEVAMGSLLGLEPGVTSVADLARDPHVLPVLLACLHHRRDECLQKEWLPLWATLANCYEAFSTLVDMQHPQTRANHTFQHIMSLSRDSRFMLKLLSAQTGWPSCGGDVMKWAAKIGSVAVLDMLLPRIPKEQRAKILSFVNEDALKRGSVEVLEWSSVRIHMDRARDAIHTGHQSVLEWLHHRQLLPTDSKSVGELAAIAASLEQLDCLRWLLETFTVSRDCIQTIQRDSRRSQRMGAVRILQRYVGESSVRRNSLPSQ